MPTLKLTVPQARELFSLIMKKPDASPDEIRAEAQGMLDALNAKVFTIDTEEMRSFLGLVLSEEDQPAEAQ